MKDNEIVQALRCCQFGEPCDRCPVVRDQNCVDVMHKCAADLIERLTAENAAMREKNWGCRQQMSEKLYGAYLTSVQNVR